MAHKLHGFKQQILDFKEQGESVRSIAAKLSESTGEKIAASTVQHFLKGNGHAESKESPQIVQALPAGSADSIQVRLDAMQAKLDLIELQLYRTDGVVRDLWHQTWTFRWNNWLNRFLRGGGVLRGNMWVNYYPRKVWRWWNND